MPNSTNSTCAGIISTDSETSTELCIFIVLIFIAFILLLVSCYSIYRENYAIDPDYLKNARTVSVATTLLQLICFCGYWSGIFIMQRLASTIWERLFSLALILMGLKFAESYILLVSTNYSLHDHTKIPTKYIIIIFLVWSIGSCIDIIGTVSGLLYVCNHQNSNIYRKIAVLCFAIWDLTSLIFAAVLLYILKNVQQKFKDILNSKMEYKKHGKAAKLLKQENKKTGLIIKKQSYMYTKAEGSLEEEKYAIKSVNTMSSLPSDRLSAISNTMGSINDSVSVLTQRGFIMMSEVKRMRILICGLYVLFCIFLFNLLFHGYQTLEEFGSINKVYFIEEMVSAEPHRDGNAHTISVWVVAFVYFPQWTVINAFVMGFSWIPGSQMLPAWTD